MLTEQLENARAEVSRPFPQEMELNAKQSRLAELNSLLNMDERGSEAATLEDGAAPDEDAREQEQPEKKKRRECAL